MKPYLAAFVAALIISSASAQAQTKSGESAWRTLDASIPVHGAIMRWLDAARSNDFAAFERLSVKNEYTTRDFLRTMFKEVRDTAPAFIMIEKEPHERNSNGSQSYFLVGCVAFPGDYLKERRQITKVLAIPMGNEWKLIGGGFSQPWNKTVRDCPVG